VEVLGRRPIKLRLFCRVNVLNFGALNLMVDKIVVMLQDGESNLRAVTLNMTSQ
jgi:hypothetical protein